MSQRLLLLALLLSVFVRPAHAQSLWIVPQNGTLVETSYTGTVATTLTSNARAGRTATNFPIGMVEAGDGSLAVLTDGGAGQGETFHVSADGSVWTTTYAHFTATPGAIALSNQYTFAGNTDTTLPGSVVRYDSSTGLARFFGSGACAALCLGQNGSVYVVSAGSSGNIQVNTYDPGTMAQLLFIQLGATYSTTTPTGIAATSDGSIVLSTSQGSLLKFGSNGVQQTAITLSAGLTNVAIGSDGSYLVGSTSGTVYVVNSSLTSFSSFNSGLGSDVVAAAFSVAGGPSLATALTAATGTVGTAFTYSVPAGTFTDSVPGTTLTYYATNLPPGLSFSATTLKITGTPTTGGSFTATIAVNDSQAIPRSATTTLAFTIGKAAATVTLSNLTGQYGDSSDSATVTTNPPGLDVMVTYNGSTLPPYQVGSYAVVATVIDPGYTGSATGTYTIVNNSPSFQSQPASVTINVGGTATFSASITGTAPFTYHWYHNGAQLLTAIGLTNSTTTSYSVFAAQATDAGSYDVIAGNSAGSATSGSATLTVNTPVATTPVVPTAPAITTAPQSQTARTGDDVQFYVVATGTTPLTYQWAFNGAAIGSATGASYLIQGVQSANAGAYTVTVGNSTGSVTSAAATLSVTPMAVPPSISLNPQDQVVLAGASAVFSVGTSGTAPLSYQWTLNGTAIDGATGSQYAIAATQTTDVGSYAVTVTNAWGSAVSSSAMLTLLQPPAISAGPTSQTVTAGTTASFSVTASSSGTLTYQWLFNGISIAGATAANYSVSSAAAANAGAYTVTVTGPGGSATSAAATLTVNPAASTAPASSSGAGGSSGGGGGGGAISLWAYAALTTIVLARSLRKKPYARRA